MPRETLFNRGMKESEMAEIWDDSALIQMYEESISSTYEKIGASKSVNGSSSQGTVGNWRVGDVCMAPFEDGYYYKATIKRLLLAEGKAEIRYEGYESIETVDIADLTTEDAAEEGEVSESVEMKSDMATATASSSSTFNPTASSANAILSKQITTRKEDRRKRMSSSSGQRFRAPIPSLAPPPFPSFSGLQCPSEEEAQASMLMSWYMNGYHTGYYQAIRDMKGQQQVSDPEGSSR